MKECVASRDHVASTQSREKHGASTPSALMKAFSSSTVTGGGRAPRRLSRIACASSRSIISKMPTPVVILSLMPAATPAAAEAPLASHVMAREMRVFLGRPAVVMWIQSRHFNDSQRTDAMACIEAAKARASGYVRMRTARRRLGKRQPVQGQRSGTAGLTGEADICGEGT